MSTRGLFLLLLLALTAGCEPQPSGPLAPVEALRGQWVVINYWAEWCKPCIREVPELNALAGLAGVSVLGVNYDGESGEALAQQEARLGIAFPTLAEAPHEALGIPLPEVLPTSFVIGPDGALRHTLVGPQTLETLLAMTLESAPPGSG